MRRVRVNPRIRLTLPHVWATLNSMQHSRFYCTSRRCAACSIVSGWSGVSVCPVLATTHVLLCCRSCSVDTPPRQLGRSRCQAPMQRVAAAHVLGLHLLVDAPATGGVQEAASPPWDPRMQSGQDDRRGLKPTPSLCCVAQHAPPLIYSCLPVRMPQRGLRQTSLITTTSKQNRRS